MVEPVNASLLAGDCPLTAATGASVAAAVGAEVAADVGVAAGVGVAPRAMVIANDRSAERRQYR